MASRLPFTPDEKNELLAEIIKQSQPNPSVLINVINTYNIQPDWPNLPLPRGRSLNACNEAFNDMRRTTPTTGLMAGGYGAQAPSPMSSAAIPLKRPFPYESSPYSGGRRIEPKPSSASGPVSQLSPIDQPPKKKRGRPTKAEAQAKAEAESQAQAQPLPPPPMVIGLMESGVIQRPPAGRSSFGTTVAAPAPPESPSMLQPPAEEVKPFVPPVTRMPISSIITPTAPTSASQSSSSSGKRKRGRSTRSEPDNGPSGEAGEGQRPEYESPYAQRTTVEQQQLQDSPARAAQLRHREEQESAPRQPPQPQQETQEYGAQAQGPTPETTTPDPGTR